MGEIKYCTMSKDMFLAKMWEPEEWYLDDQVLSLLVSAPSRKGNAVQYHLAVLNEGGVVRFGEWNKSLRKDIREAYLRSLTEALTRVLEQGCPWEGKPCVSLNFGVTEEAQKEQPNGPALRIVLLAKGVQPMEAQAEERLRKELRAEFSDWLEMVFRDVSQKIRGSEPETDLSAYVSAELLPHEKSDGKYDLTMTVLAILFLGLSLFFKEWFVFQVIAVGIAGCGAFRSAQHKHYVCLALCTLTAVAGLAVAWSAYADLKESMQGVTLPVRK